MALYLHAAFPLPSPFNKCYFIFLHNYFLSRQFTQQHSFYGQINKQKIEGNLFLEVMELEVIESDLKPGCIITKT